MDQNQNSNNPNGIPDPFPGPTSPPQPPPMNDPRPPDYGDPMPPPPGPPPQAPPPGLPPAPASSQNSANFNNASHAGRSGSLTNPTKDERNWGMFAHLSAIAAGLVLMFTSIPAFGFIGPLVIYLMKKDESAFIADQAKEALNFNISVGILLFGMWLLGLLLVWTIIVPFLMIALTGVVGVGALVLVIIAAIKASEGKAYRYPFTLRLIS